MRLILLIILYLFDFIGVFILARQQAAQNEKQQPAGDDSQGDGGKHLARADIALPERLNTRGGDAVTAPEAVVIIAIDGFYFLAGLLAGLLT